MKHTIKISTLIAAILFSMTGFSQNYAADTDKSLIRWEGRKITGSHDGNINLQSGSIEMKNGKIISGEFVVDMTSIEVTDLSGSSKENLEEHLKSDDFFGVHNHETATLKIKETGSFATGYADVKADLTIKGITLPIEFSAVRKKIDGGHAFYSKITVDRTKYDIRYNSGKFFSDLGDNTISDNFDIAVKLIALKE